MNTPEFLGPYRIGETLGKGGMGSVYRAKHEKTGEPVAVKLISPQVSDDMRFRRRFDMEIETLRMLGHRNIVKLIGYGEEQGLLFYSMEYVDGETLQAIIRREKKLDWATAVDIAIQIASALKHAHDIGVFHRDLKPANLIVDQSGTVKLVDFGISKIFGRELTAVGSIMGTADYMAPEQATGGRTTARTDLFALGLVLYAMLCGKPPFRGKNVTEVIAALTEQDPIPLELIDPHLPEDVVQLVNDLLEKQPENRPPTALVVLNRLKAMQAGLKQTVASGENTADDPDSRPTLSPDDDADTAVSGLIDEAKQKTEFTSNKTRRMETVEFSPSGNTEDTRDFDDPQGDNEIGTSISSIDLSAKTVATDGHGDSETMLGTGVTAPGLPGGIPPSSQPTQMQKKQASSSVADDSSGGTDTSIGSGGNTHFQTVSDSDVRDGFFTSPHTKRDHPLLKIASIAVLCVGLFTGAVILALFLPGPTAEDLLAEIDQMQASDQTSEAQNEIGRFLKLYPDHPKAEQLREQQMAYRVSAAVRRLKLKAKLRTEDGPVHETVFLEAMDLRRSDPLAAREKLQHWLAVFGNSDTNPGEEIRQLVELAEFQIKELKQLKVKGPGDEDDPQLVQLLKQIRASDSKPERERREYLEAVIKLYENQPWAEEARQLARELLQVDQ